VYVLYFITGLALIVSLIASRGKTRHALKISFQRLVTILPAFVTMLILVSVVLFFVPDNVIFACFGNHNRAIGVIVALFFGSITLMPGFIAYPLCGIMLEKGVTYMVLAAFSTTLMMVGVLTYPIESRYFGAKVTILRNLVSLFIAAAVAIATGIFFGEIG